MTTVTPRLSVIAAGFLIVSATAMQASATQTPTESVRPIETVALADLSPADPTAQLYIGWPNDGEVITGGKFRIWFGLRRMGVAPAGAQVEGTGHHHLLINTGLPPLDEEIPADRAHIHFGAGQTEAVIELPPGKHTLQLIMGDHNHIPHDPPVMSKKITITVR